MKDSILIGNGINNLSNGQSWEALVQELIATSNSKINNINKKPFPLLYEEIYFHSREYYKTENHLKRKIGEIVGQIQPNETHKKFMSLNCDNYITTNYDYVLQNCIDDSRVSNHGVIKEKRYSLFRHTKIGEKKVWHVHGEINAPRTINLGFEHYGGQLQRLRNYVVNGAAYKKNRNYRRPLHYRILNGTLDFESWVDLIYKTDIHIVGLNLGYEETDLWWLFTVRERFYSKHSHLKKNNIFYYCPKKYLDQAKEELMTAVGITTISINKTGSTFYDAVFEIVQDKMTK